MPNPTSKLRRVARGGLRRRPSASMTVAMLALFVALSGGAYAAVTIPKASVGATQLKTFAVTNTKLGTGSVGTRKIMTGAVTYAKIAPGSVGNVRIDKNEVQARLQSSCTTGQAISAVDNTGKVTCASTGSGETNSAAGSAVAVSSSTTAATVSAVSLPAGSAYEVQANPYITVTPSTVSSAAAQHVVVTCTLSNAGTAQAQRSASFDIPDFTSNPQVETASIPLIAVSASNTAAATSQVTCVSNVTASASGNTATNPASVTAQGQIYATGVASVTTGTTPTTSTTTTTSTTPAP
jgi:hypothetical protein